MKVRKAVIPAAGLGTRMLPASKSVPKEMLPMVDKPVLQYIVEEAVAAGIEDILIITNRGKGAMDDYFDYAPELERRLEASGKMAELAAVRRPAELANLYFIRQKAGPCHRAGQTFRGGRTLCHPAGGRYHAGRKAGHRPADRSGRSVRRLGHRGPAGPR